MEALKRAYADIILNTVKDSAARVMASERKAAQLQQGLAMAKDEAVAMLVHVKSVMDAKMKEVEKLNTSQGRRIKELELHLTEAKVTIDCLRSNIKRVNLELESKKNNGTEISDEHSTGANDTLVPGTNHGTVNVPHANFRQVDSLKQVEISKKSFPSEDSTENPDLAPMILSRKPELYRNGCTQRIHAVEHNMLNGREAFVEEYSIKNKTIRHQNGKVESASNDTLDLANNKTTLVKKLPKSGVDQQGRVSVNCHATGFFNQSFSKKQRSRRKHDSGYPVFHAFVDTALKYHELIDTDCPKTHSANCLSSHSVTMHATLEEGPQKTAPDTLSQVLRGNENVERVENIPLDKVLDHESSHHVVVNRTITKRATMKQDSDHFEGHIGTNYVHAGKSDCNITKEEPDAVANLDTRTLLNDDANSSLQIEKSLVLPSWEHKTSEDLDTYELKENHIAYDKFKNDVCDVGELCKLSDPAAEGRGDRIVKYTFQRKRKRELSCNRNESLQFQQKDLVKQKRVKEKSLIEPLKPSSPIESSTESRRLAQVARQLISLSEKRWQYMELPSVFSPENVESVHPI